jgi:hypothetical protein
MDKEYLKSIKYIIIDYTEKIYNIENYYILINKAHNPKYSNVIFFINFNNIKKKMKKELKKILRRNDLDDTNIYFNKDNFIFYNNDFIIPINRIDDFINTGDNYCNICFDKFDNLNVCHSCNFKSCDKCLIESFKNKKNKINISNNVYKMECVVCGCINGEITQIIKSI